MIEAGRLTDKVNILRRVLSKDKWGSEAIKYIKELTTRANVLVENGQMTERANEIYYTYNISVLCRKLRVAEYDVVEWRGDYYQVQSIVPTRERDGQYIKAIKIDSTLIIPALVRKYNVKFYTYREGVDYLYAETETTDDGTFTFPVPPSRTGYQFSGWYTLPEGEGVVVDEGYVAHEDIKVYAYMMEYSTERDKLYYALSETLREALIGWYDPAVQGLTNEEAGAGGLLLNLADNEVNNLRLHNFAGTSASGVTEDGGLQFDGVNDYADTDNFVGLDKHEYTVFLHQTGASRIQTSRASVCNGTGTESSSVSGYPNTEGYFVLHCYTNEIRNMGIVTKNVSGAPAIWVQTSHNFYNADPTYLASTAVSRNDNQPSSPLLCVGAKYSKAGSYMKMTMYQLIIFDRDLTETEIYDVRDILIKKVAK